MAAEVQDQPLATIGDGARGRSFSSLEEVWKRISGGWGRPREPSVWATLQARGAELKPLVQMIAELLETWPHRTATTYVSTAYDVATGSKLVRVSAEPEHFEECKRMIEENKTVQEERERVRGVIVYERVETLIA